MAQHDKAFPDRLARLMAERDMTKADVAREVWGTFTDERGYTVARNRQSLSKYLSGKQYPKGETKRKLAEALGVTYAQLFPLEAPQDRPGSGVTLETLSGKECRLTLSVTLPTELAMRIIEEVRPYT